MVLFESVDNPIWYALTTNTGPWPAGMALRDDIRRMFHRWGLCFIPRMTHSPVYNGWSVPASTSRYLPPVPSTGPATDKSTPLGG